MIGSKIVAIPATNESISLSTSSLLVVLQTFLGNRKHPEGPNSGAGTWGHQEKSVCVCVWAGGGRGSGRARADFTLKLKGTGRMKPVICCCLVAKSCPTLLQPRGQQPTTLFCPWDFPGKNTGGGCHLLLQQIFLTQGSNPCLLHWQADSSPLSHQGSPKPMIHPTYSKRQN